MAEVPHPHPSDRSNRRVGSCRTHEAGYEQPRRRSSSSSRNRSPGRGRPESIVLLPPSPCPWPALAQFDARLSRPHLLHSTLHPSRARQLFGILLLSVLADRPQQWSVARGSVKSPSRVSSLVYQCNTYLTRTTTLRFFLRRQDVGWQRLPDLCNAVTFERYLDASHNRDSEPRVICRTPLSPAQLLICPPE